MNLKDKQERERVVKQYQPLVWKIVRQQLKKTALSQDDVLGFAEEGLVDAMNTYDSTRGQTFHQYAAYRILYFIQNGSNTQGHTVTFSAYMQKKAKERGESTWIMKSIEARVDDQGEEHYNIPVPSCSMYISSIDDILQELYSFIEHKFSERDCTIFYKSLGLKQYEVYSGVELAKYYKCSSPNISLIIKKIVKYIRGNSKMMDLLSSMLNMNNGQADL